MFRLKSFFALPPGGDPTKCNQITHPVCFAFREDNSCCASARSQASIRMPEMIEGFSDDFVYVIASCVLSTGAGFAWDHFMHRPSHNSSKRKVNGTVCKFLPSNSDVPSTFSETAAALRDGQLPSCPICLELVRHAVETSWWAPFPLPS